MRDGHRVLHRFIRVDDGDVEALEGHVLRDNERVFNPDGLRVQRLLGADHDVVRRVERAAASRGLLRGRRVGEATVLYSHAGCKRQPLHWDYDPSEMAALRVQPLGLLVAFEPNTSIYVADAGRVHLGPGDAFVFAGDVAHAGEAYPTAPNVRLHVYLDVPSHDRPPNKTYLVPPARR